MTYRLDAGLSVSLSDDKAKSMGRIFVSLPVRAQLGCNLRTGALDEGWHVLPKILKKRKSSDGALKKLHPHLCTNESGSMGIHHGHPKQFFSRLTPTGAYS